MSITALTVVTPPTNFALSLSEAKAHLRVTHSAEDAHIQSLIAAATDWAQSYMRRHLCKTEVALKFDCFPATGRVYYIGYSGDVQNRFDNGRDMSIYLPGGKVTQIEDISYFDVNGAVQILTGSTSDTPGVDYQEDITDDEWPVVYPAIESTWPDTETDRVNAVTIRYQAGWTSPSDIPASIVHGIKFKLADFYLVRSPWNAKTANADAAESLLDPYVVPVL